MINIVDKSKCCGCNACGDICPKGSITFKPDIEGFMYPEVNMDTCIDCNLCEKVCPIINVKEIKKNDFEESICYAAQTKNLDSLFNSTSGSAFATLAEKMYKLGGYVGGAIFNDDYSVTQFISSDKEDLEKLRNSKYVQSDSQGFFKKVKELIVAGEKVLVCGLPCQMAGLRSFLRKDYDNLIIVDLICLGINSPKILRGYLDYMEEKHNSKIVYYKAKNKELGWRQLTTKIVFANGDVEYDKRDTNYFTHGFIGTHAFARPSCYECKFKGTPRIADITIGDLWGAEKMVGKDYDSDLGTSVVMINSKKGLDYYNLAKIPFKEVEVKYSDVLKGNPALVKSLSKPNLNRESFYEDLNNLPFEQIAKKYIQLPCDRPISNKQKLLNVLRFFRDIWKASGCSFLTWFKNIKLNIFSKRIKTNILNQHYIVINKNCVIDIRKNAEVLVNGVLNFGYKRIQGSKLESRLLIEDGATLVVGKGTIYYGADIEVFKNAKLSLGSGIIFNINSTIICGGEISIGDDVHLGRDILIRDNNGGHYISRRTYKNIRPVIIGQHCWICERSMIMPGAKLGAGVIVGANSMVSSKVKNFTLVSGSPAQVVDEDIYWKA